MSVRTASPSWVMSESPIATTLTAPADAGAGASASAANSVEDNAGG